MEEALNIRLEVYGETSDEVRLSPVRCGTNGPLYSIIKLLISCVSSAICFRCCLCKKVCVTASEYFFEIICSIVEKFEAVVEFLRKAESLAQNSLDLKAITYNNMACYYRRYEKLIIQGLYLQGCLSWGN